MADLEKVLIQSDSIQSVCHVARPCFINEALATQNPSRGFMSTVVKERPLFHSFSLASISLYSIPRLEDSLILGYPSSRNPGWLRNWEGLMYLGAEIPAVFCPDATLVA